MAAIRRVLCAPDKFKGTLSAAEAAHAMARGCRDADPAVEVDECPVADGGEGSMRILIGALDGRVIARRVCGPLPGREVDGEFGFVDRSKLAIVELASASGLVLLREEEHDPMRTTTFGTGQLVRAAIDAGAREVIICLGGSATVDGGCGLAQALGVRFLDENNRALREPITGEMVDRIARIDRGSAAFGGVVLRAACDVTNGLLGEAGAARTYGPQKGGTPHQVESLERNLARLTSLLRESDARTKGSGAAGGAGFGVLAMLGGTLEAGAELILDAIGFDERCRVSDLVLTGEGRLDAQSLHGKACMAVAQHAAALRVPTVAIGGQFGEGYEQCVDERDRSKLTAAYSLGMFGTELAMNKPAEALERVSSHIVGTWNARSTRSI